MKVIRETPWELKMRSSNLFTKLWSFGMFGACSFALYLALDDYNDNVFPVVIISSVMMVIALLVFIFVTKTLGYEFDKKQNSCKILYPGALGVKHDITSFKMDDLRCLKYKGAIGYSKETNSTRGYLGFDFIFKSGRKVHGGIYATNHKKIQRIVGKVSTFLDLPVLERGQKVSILIS